MKSNLAIFLDRDGVLIEDMDLLINANQIHVMPGVPAALQDLKRAGFQLIVISNQPVVARGLITEAGVLALQEEVNCHLMAVGAPKLDAFYFCPHHPNATLLAYRMDCDCRKPKPGLLLRAAEDYGINLTQSFMIGDRITDIVAAASAGCRTILVQTGKHLAPIIETRSPFDTNIQPDFTCPDLPSAARKILEIA